MLSKRIFEDITKDCPCDNHGLNEKWCFFRAYVESLDDRVVEQARLVVDYQYDRDIKDGKKMTFQEAYMGFVKEGYAKRFREIWEQGKITREEIFPLLFGYEIQMPTDEEINEHIANN
jgi:hypothetical protein